jgi:hypothetical protein
MRNLPRRSKWLPGIRPLFAYPMVALFAAGCMPHGRESLAARFAGDDRVLRRLVIERRIAPFFRGEDDQGDNLEEVREIFPTAFGGATFGGHVPRDAQPALGTASDGVLSPFCS